MDITRPYKFIGFGAMDVTKPYKFIRFGAMDVTRPYKFIGFGAMGIPGNQVYQSPGYDWTASISGSTGMTEPGYIRAPSISEPRL
jgi:hypothetical protein